MEATELCHFLIYLRTCTRTILWRFFRQKKISCHQYKFILRILHIFYYHNEDIVKFRCKRIGLKQSLHLPSVVQNLQFINYFNHLLYIKLKNELKSDGNVVEEEVFGNELFKKLCTYERWGIVRVLFLLCSKPAQTETGNLVVPPIIKCSFFRGCLFLMFVEFFAFATFHSLQ